MRSEEKSRTRGIPSHTLPYLPVKMRREHIRRDMLSHSSNSVESGNPTPDPGCSMPGEVKHPPVGGEDRLHVMVVTGGGTTFPTAQGGAANYALRQAIALSRAGAEVTLIGQGHLADGDRLPNLTLISTPRAVSYNSKFYLLYFAKAFSASIYTALTAASYLRRYKGVQVVHCHHNVSVVVLRFLFPKVPIVYTLHDPPFSAQDRGHVTLEGVIRVVNNLVMEKLAIRFSGHVFAVSNGIAETIRSWGVGNKGCDVLRPMPMVSFQDPPGLSHIDGKPSETIVPGSYVLAVGSLTGRKRVDLILHALALSKSDVRIVILGGGHAKPSLLRMSHFLGTVDRVRWLEHVGRDTLMQLYRTARFAILVSDREGFPTTLLEAVYEGTPALYVRTKDSSGDESNKFLKVLNSHDPTEIAATIDALWSAWDPALLDRALVQAWAHSYILSPSEVAAKLLSAYRALVP